MNASATSFPVSDKKASHYLHWFRRDLRTHDNTALAHAVSQARESQGKVSAVFILTPQQWFEHDMYWCKSILSYGHLPFCELPDSLALKCIF